MRLINLSVRRYKQLAIIECENYSEKTVEIGKAELFRGQQRAIRSAMDLGCQAHGGLAYFMAYMTAMILGECINFPIQKLFVFRSHGDTGKQIAWYAAAFP